MEEEHIFYKFNMRKLASLIDAESGNCPAMVLIAKRGAGKSWMVREILYHISRDENGKSITPNGTIISKTEAQSPFYQTFFPDLFIHNEVDVSIVERVLIRQQLAAARYLKRKENGERLNNPCSVLVMDDCLSEAKNWINDKTIREVLMNGRHYKLVYILVMQSPLGVPPPIRENFDFCFIFGGAPPNNYKKIMDNYAGAFPSVKTFASVYPELTKDKAAMIVDNKGVKNNISESVFTYKAMKRDFTFGDKNFQKYHEKYYDPEILCQDIQKKVEAIHPFLSGKVQKPLHIVHILDQLEEESIKEIDPPSEH